MPVEYSFSEAPPLGTKHERYGNRYELVEIRPHTRRDGTPSAILTWQGDCADCGVPFLQTQGLTTNSLNRRCDYCKNPTRCATKEARKARKAGGRKGSKLAAEKRARQSLLS